MLAKSGSQEENEVVEMSGQHVGVAFTFDKKLFMPVLLKLVEGVWNENLIQKRKGNELSLLFLGAFLRCSGESRPRCRTETLLVTVFGS
jgi:hypothetical protein